MIRHHSKAIQAATRAAHPGCFLVEVVTPYATALLAVPDTPENRDRALECAPAITGDMLEDLSHTSHTSSLPMPSELQEQETNA